MDLQTIIKSCEKSDRGAQRKLFEFFKVEMMGICLRYSKNEEQANEIFKSGFVNIFNNIKYITDGHQVKSWIKKTMIDTAITMLRKNRQEYKIVSTINAYDTMMQQEKIVDDEVMREIEEGDILKAVQALTPAYRVVVNMYLLDNYTFNQISEKLDVGESTIQLNFRKAMHQIHKNIVQLTTVSNAE